MNENRQINAPTPVTLPPLASMSAEVVFWMLVVGVIVVAVVVYVLAT